jgi:hypothetical protein
MSATDLLGLLGRPASEPGIRFALAEFGITSAPALPAPEPPADEQEWFDWLISGRWGIEFGFEDQAYFLAQEPALRGNLPLLLTQLYFYCDHPGVQPYQGDLPFGLLRTDNRAEVRRKLREIDARRRFNIRDVWDMPRFRMIVSYAPDDAGIASILCLLPIRPWPVTQDETTLLPRTAQLAGLLGQTAAAPALRQVLAPLGLAPFAFDGSRVGKWQLRHAYGFELSFVDPEATDTNAEADDLPVLGSVRFYRDRDLDSYGWKGELPFALDFNDSQDVLLEKVGHPPDMRQDSDLHGFALWHFPQFSLHVMYSNLENQLRRVTLMQPGLWVSAAEP